MYVCMYVCIFICVYVYMYVCMYVSIYLYGKLTEITRQEAEDKRIVLLMKYNMQNGFLNWGKLEMEMECDDLSWKKCLLTTVLCPEFTA